MPSQVELDQIKEFLNEHRLATLSTASMNGQPHGASIYVWADADLNFYFTTQTDTRKHSFAMARNQVALTIADAGMQVTVQIEGKAELIEDVETGKQVIRGLADAPAQAIPHWPPPVSKLGNEYSIIKVTPTWMRLANFSKTDVKNPSGYFTQILP